MAEKEIGRIMHYFGHVSAAVIKLSDTLKVGDKIRIKGHSEDFVQDVDSMQVDRQPVSEAKPQEEVGIKVAQKVHENDVVYKVA